MHGQQCSAQFAQINHSNLPPGMMGLMRTLRVVASYCSYDTSYLRRYLYDMYNTVQSVIVAEEIVFFFS